MSNTISSSVDKKAQLKEVALLNIQNLFHLWGIEYTKVNEVEYDFISKSRIDNHFGAVRFNVEKGLGADFASTTFTESDFNAIGAGFSREDFGFSKSKVASYGFDIIGLCQRIHGLDTYNQGYRQLASDLKQVEKISGVQKPDLDAHVKRIERNQADLKKKIDYALTILKWSKNYRGTIGEKYLNYRSIALIDHEKDMTFHGKIMCKDAGKPLPALLFAIRNLPETDVVGIHRIYIKEDGQGKADIANPKMAVGSVKGNAIWFGTPCDTLYIVEGPENALTLRLIGADFVACAVFAGNIPNLTIPDYVTKVVICPDRDKAGIAAANKALIAYNKKSPRVNLPKEKILKNGKYADFNDLLMGTE